MVEAVSYLVWFGAGEAKLPSHLVDQAKRVVLVEAREEAYYILKRKYRTDKFQVVNKLLTVAGGEHTFNEYNLPEYSSLQQATGLKNLYPGIKILRQQTLPSISLDQFFNELKLQDGNNLLVVDLPDLSQTFLDGLVRTKEFYKFNKFYIGVNREPLFLNSMNAYAVEEFLNSKGFLLEGAIDTNPDFPYFLFRKNPLWTKLEEANQLNIKLVSDTKELSSQQESLCHQLDELKRQFELANKEKDLAYKQASTRKETIGRLEKNKRELEESNKNFALKQNLLEKELIKAEAQIDLLKTLLIKN